MIIKNILLFFVFMIWSYIIFVCFLKLVKDKICKWNYYRKQRWLNAFLKKNTRNKKRILNKLKDFYLLEYMCDCFVKHMIKDEKWAYEVLKEAFQQYRILHPNINPYERLMLDNMEKAMHLVGVKN